MLSLAILDSRKLVNLLLDLCYLTRGLDKSLGIIHIITALIIRVGGGSLRTG